MKTAYLFEYSFGFFARFLTAYPTKLLSEKNTPRCFLTRLTKNNPSKNMSLGNRVWAIWQGAEVTFILQQTMLLQESQLN